MKAIKLGLGLLLFSMVALGFIAVALEVGVRAKERLDSRPFQIGGGKEARLDKSIQAPVYTFREYTGMYNETNMRLPQVTTNSRGFRGTREVTIPKPKGTTRIFVIGGSAAVGFSASNDAATMPAQLETYLKEQLKNPNIEVFNAACSGFSSTQDLVLLSTEVMTLEPDLVVALGGGTDLNISMYPQWRHGFHELTERLEALGHAPWHDHSRAVQLFKRLMAANKIQKAQGVFHPAVAKDYADNVLRMANISVGEGVPFLNVLQPALLLSSKARTSEEEAAIAKIDQGGLSWGYQSLIKQLYPLARQRLARTQLPPRAFLMDASDAFAGTSAHLFSDAFHLTDAGYRSLAEQVGTFIIDKNLLSGAGKRPRDFASSH